MALAPLFLSTARETLGWQSQNLAANFLLMQLHTTTTTFTKREGGASTDGPSVKVHFSMKIYSKKHSRVIKMMLFPI